MKGIELTHRGRTVSAELENGLVTVFVVSRYDEMNVTLRKHDPQQEEKEAAYRSELVEGDSIRIRITDTKTAEEAEKHLRETLQERYRTLKKELEEKGVL